MASEQSIRILDTQTTQSIAAGEVVERPASVVKELCENSIDAGADRLQIYIEQGGKKSIRISDNGSGMSFADAKMAFADHATSKIEKISDLDQLMTLGFRGEALPTIAAVSKLTLQTKRPEDETGTFIRIDGGELTEHSRRPCNDGTSIEVRDLFYNTPARFKFLKKDQTEAGRISDTVQDLALSRPDISFYLENSGKEVLHTPGDNQLISAIYAIFGQKTAQSMVPLLPAEENAMVRTEGYLGLPEAARKSRSRQLFFVNGRAVKAPVLTRALEDAYKSTLMTGRYPAAVLKVQIPQNLVDVNVHPRKLELRFWNDSEVYRAVYHQVQNSLFTALRPPLKESEERPEETEAPAAAPAGKTGLAAESGEDQREERKKEAASGSAPAGHGGQALRPRAKDMPPLHFDLGGFGRASFKDERKPYQSFPVLDKQEEAPETKTEENSGREEGFSQISFTEEEEGDERLLRLKKARFAGQLFNTYLLFEEGETCYIIDQHAAHEKVLFEEAVDDYRRNREIRAQMLLEPAVAELTAAEVLFIEENKELWPALGFDLDFFGRNKVLLRSMPIGPGYLDPEKTFRNILDEAMANGPEDIKGNSEVVYHLLATDSCKAAVKAHDHLNSTEADALRNQLLELKNPYHCPHGRPVIIEVDSRTFEKLFKRIV